MTRIQRIRPALIRWIRLLKQSRTPLIAFVTAYDEYAVRAFEVNAVDYVLKPVDRARLRETLNRAHERLDRALSEFRRAGRLHRPANDSVILLRQRARPIRVRIASERHQFVSRQRADRDPLREHHAQSLSRFARRQPMNIHSIE